MPEHGAPVDRSGADAAAESDAFVEALLDPACPPPPELGCWNGSDVGRRFDVHRNTVVHSLVTALADTFPATRARVGPEAFDRLAIEFVRQHPPDSPRLDRFGERFPEWLSAAATEAGGLDDLARLEFAYLAAGTAPDATALSASEIARHLEAPEGLAAAIVVLHPSASVVVSDWPIASWWLAEQRGEPPAEAPHGAECALVFRRHDVVLVLPIAPAEGALARSLADGMTLGAALEAHPGADFAGLLGQWILHEWIVGFRAPAHERPFSRNLPP